MSSVHRPTGPCEAASRSESTTAAPNAGRRPYRTTCENPAALLQRATVPRTQPSVGHGPSHEGRAGNDLGRGREPESGRRHKGRRQPRCSGGRSSGRVRGSPASGAAAWCGGVRRRTPPPSPGSATALLHAQPFVVRRCMPQLPHQVACDAARRPAVEQQLHLVFTLLPHLGHRPGGWQLPPPARKRA